jgi:hypothetical protein
MATAFQAVVSSMIAVAVFSGVLFGQKSEGEPVKTVRITGRIVSHFQLPSAWHKL